MALFGSFATVRTQVPQNDGFTTAFAHVEDLMRPASAAAARLRSMAIGSSQKIELGRGVFAIEQVYETKDRPDGFFESHRTYIDVQVVIEGEELMELVDVTRIRVTQPYQSERDLIVYEDYGDATLLRTLAGDAAIFYPADVHMPSLRLRATPAVVRKCVVKVPVG